jgi:hypothetical protein
MSTTPAVTHPSTSQYYRGSTLAIGWEAVFSACYGRTREGDNLAYMPVYQAGWSGRQIFRTAKIA